MKVTGKPAPRQSLYTTAGVPIVILWALAIVLLVTTGALQLRRLDDRTTLRGIETAQQIRDHAVAANHLHSANQLTPELTLLLDQLVDGTPDTTVTITDTNGQLLYGNTVNFIDETQQEVTVPLITRDGRLAGNVRVITDGADQYQLVLRRYAGLVFGLVLLGFYLLWRLRARFRKFEQDSTALSACLTALEQGNYSSLPATSGTPEIAGIFQRINALAQALRRAQSERDERAMAASKELNATLEEIEIKNVELDLARKRAEEENAAKSYFLANISHEIRSPMNGIIGHLQLLQRMALSARQQTFVENTLLAAHALLDLIDNTLQISRIEANRLDIQSEPFKLLNEIHRCLIMLAPDARKKKLDLYFWSDPSLPTVFIGDSLRIRQVVTNLISNAIKYTDAGSVHLRISGEPGPGNKCALSITVADTGHGMSSPQIESLFEAYSQAGRSPEGGSGLGLMITRSLTEAMGGRLDLASTLHQGTEFTVRLPMSYQQSFVAPAKPGSRAAQVVLDCQVAATRQYYTELLEFNGYSVADTTSQTGDIRLSVWTHEHIDRLHETSLDDLFPDGHCLLPQVILAGRDDFTGTTLLNRPAECEVLPLYSPARLIIEALEKLLDHTSQTSADQQDRSVLPAQEADADSATVQSLAGLRVLLAEDDEFGRAYMNELLSQHDMIVDQCADGHSAIAHASAAAYDLVLLDLRMPGCDGIEAARRIRELAHTHATPIIGLTASVSPELHQQCFNAGMTDCWVKPLQISALINGLQYWTRDSMEVRHPGPLPKSPAQTNENAPALDHELSDLLRIEFDKFEAHYKGGWRDSIDIAQLREHAHSLNGSAAICRLSALQHAAEQVERQVRNGTTENLPQALEHLLLAIARARDTLGNAAA